MAEDEQSVAVYWEVLVQKQAHMVWLRQDGIPTHLPDAHQHHLGCICQQHPPHVVCDSHQGPMRGWAHHICLAGVVTHLVTKAAGIRSRGETSDLLQQHLSPESCMIQLVQAVGCCSRAQ